MCTLNILSLEAGCGASLADFCFHVNVLVAPNTKAESCAGRAWLQSDFLILQQHYITTSENLQDTEIDLSSKTAPMDAAYMTLFKLEHCRKDKLL